MYTDQLCARWLFLEEKATQRLWFRCIAVGEPLYRLGWRRLGLRGGPARVKSGAGSVSGVQ
jgi:hypothetical protein